MQMWLGEFCFVFSVVEYRKVKFIYQFQYRKFNRSCVQFNITRNRCCWYSYRYIKMVDTIKYPIFLKKPVKQLI